MMPHWKINKGGSGFFLLIIMVLVIQFIETPSRDVGPKKGNPEEGFYIQVSGRVRNPGVYWFKVPPHAEDVLNRAGGIAPFAPFTFNKMIPKVPRLRTGSRLLVHLDGGKATLTVDSMSAFYKMTLLIPISLNQESEEGLTAIPGVGKKISRAIIEERRKRGGFATMNELLTIDGIGEGLFNRIISHATL